MIYIKTDFCRLNTSCASSDLRLLLRAQNYNPKNKVRNVYLFECLCSNAAAEFFNAKIKLFRANLHVVADKKFFF